MSNAKIDKIRAKQEALKTQLRRETSKLQSRARAVDTRRKVLVGAAILARAETDAAFRAELRICLDKFLVRGNDRALFDFPALPGHPVEAASEPGEATGEAGQQPEIKAA